MDTTAERVRVDALTVIGLACLFMPALTMWHELGGHAGACLATGGQIRGIGAFYVDCAAPERWRGMLVAGAGVTVDAALALIAYQLWRRARAPFWRLALWYIWLGKAFVAAGYFLFSGVSGIGDLGTGADGGLHGVPFPVAIRMGEIVIGALAYWRLVIVGITTLGSMIGGGRASMSTRRRVAHLYYATVGAASVVVGLLNPLGLFITIASAAASSLGGYAGMISIGFAPGRDATVPGFVVGRSWLALALGLIMLTLFASILGPSIRFAMHRG